VAAMMFMGQFRHNLDSKNRLIIPVKFREPLGANFVVTKGLDGCLSVYTAEKWESMISRLAQIPATKKEARMYLRTLTGNAMECDLDNQGRIQLPQFLVSLAHFTKSCVIVGVADHVEIWPEEQWDTYDDLASESFESIAESLTEYLQ
jgi:MraZ protein